MPQQQNKCVQARSPQRKGVLRRRIFCAGGNHAVKFVPSKRKCGRVGDFGWLDGERGVLNNPAGVMDETEECSESFKLFAGGVIFILPGLPEGPERVNVEII